MNKGNNYIEESRGKNKTKKLLILTIKQLSLKTAFSGDFETYRQI